MFSMRKKGVGMQVDVLGVDGAVSGAVELNQEVFGAQVSEGSVYYKLRNECANARQGTVKTKQRGEVSYSGRKPWRQKGTGRARAGTRRSPIWVGGGTIFGPQPRDYSYTLPKKIRRLAFRSVLTKKLADKSLVVVESVHSSDGKTKGFADAVRNFVPQEYHNAVLIIDDHDVLVRRAARNIPWLTVLVYSQLVLQKLLYAQRIVVTKAAVEKLNVFFHNKGDAHES